MTSSLSALALLPREIFRQSLSFLEDTILTIVNTTALLLSRNSIPLKFFIKIAPDLLPVAKTTFCRVPEL